ncbi:MAG: hypothetical protein BJ554DRAFT_655 [Olpidium bornovanus]|uniref:C-CAP/cofactor C-like domain-containing protein n=1 Tax=Olpidium bornovanus TaxID=278681 RepID=A0A8H7ZU20_9FUNG|nr:MAG: hypothetical protein BJ554DRAFT_655 [Olpidium bornovanus]
MYELVDANACLGQPIDYTCYICTALVLGSPSDIEKQVAVKPRNREFNITKRECRTNHSAPSLSNAPTGRQQAANLLLDRCVKQCNWPSRCSWSVTTTPGKASLRRVRCRRELPAPSQARKAASRNWPPFAGSRLPLPPCERENTMADGPNSAATASSDAVGGRVVSKEAAAHFFSWFQAEKEVLLGELADRRSVLAPKTKFLFKSKSKPPGAAPVPNPSPDCTAAPLQPVAKTAPATAATFTLEHRKDAHVDIGEVASANRNTNNDCLIRNLENCTVNLIREGVHLGALHISGINNCVVVAGAVAGAAIVRECVGSVLVLGCHQVRQCRPIVFAMAYQARV